MLQIGKNRTKFSQYSSREYIFYIFNKDILCDLYRANVDATMW